MSKESNVLDCLKNYMRSGYFWIPRILVLGLCFLHDKTKYKVCRTFTDLFYWPNGFCLDMVVVIAFFLTAMISIYFDYERMLKPVWEEMESIFRKKK